MDMVHDPIQVIWQPWEKRHNIIQWPDMEIKAPVAEEAPEAVDEAEEAARVGGAVGEALDREEEEEVDRDLEEDLMLTTRNLWTSMKAL